ncbi:hypothetical protein MBM_03337 [Drepanopeziza brunnea f. sp. 'multigermtubi' MB_m1]|uniref:Uncharacterized protein n=1 Tax=Marssonina brunnea f. sp. multigermtubi (strain MB_m1) TaxID=1072389 RepID=K1XZS2_MARBU|nr:uncharacterized protein MBM_03337 [Drepanopeziza brunnea f. sp. 'multigermtubi' MB_m1]EKD18344.1 hypothetical protein MBM_03337 [Drepanopeziza brunnea f. sp. 'multigermtubi' MB_m1]
MLPRAKLRDEPFKRTRGRPLRFISLRSALRKSLQPFTYQKMKDDIKDLTIRFEKLQNKHNKQLKDSSKKKIALSESLKASETTREANLKSHSKAIEKLQQQLTRAQENKDRFKEQARSKEQALIEANRSLAKVTQALNEAKDNYENFTWSDYALSPAKRLIEEPASARSSAHLNTTTDIEDSISISNARTTLIPNNSLASTDNANRTSAIEAANAFELMTLL